MINKVLGGLLILVAIFLAVNLKTANSVTFGELQNQIDAKKQLLEQLEQEEARYNEELSKTQETKKTLNGELNRIKSEINNVNFKIKVTETTIDKLILEIKQLELERKSTTEEIEFKKEVLAQNLRNLYEKDKNNNMLTLFLKNENLSDAMLEIESMVSFGKTIKDDVNKLQELKNILTEQKTSSENKKKQMEESKNILNSRKIIAVNLQSEKTDILNKTKNQEKNYQALLQDIEKRRVEIEAEIDRLEESLKAEIDPNLLPTFKSGLLLWPVSGKITQNFGATSAAKYFYSKGYYKNPTHNGIDIQASIGMPILAADDGEVIALGNQDRYCYRAAYGKYIVIRHNNYLTTLYAHLSLQSVQTGDIVKRGEIIGYTGNSGFSTGPHLHFTVYFSPTFRITSSNFCGPMPIGAPVNPLNYL